MSPFRHLSPTSFVPTSFCYERSHRYRYGDYGSSEVDCPSGFKCCDVFHNGRADCGPVDFCET